MLHLRPLGAPAAFGLAAPVAVTATASFAAASVRASADPVGASSLAIEYSDTTVVPAAPNRGGLDPGRCGVTQGSTTAASVPA